MNSSVPRTMKAVVIEEGHRVSVKDHPTPLIGDDDVLIKTVSVAQNPTDWKHVDDLGVPGSVLGCDVSGIVAKVGQNVSAPKVGDHVAAFVHGGQFPDEGAFAEYVKAPAELVWAVPENTFSHDEAATLSCALLTAVQALYHPTRLGLVEPPAKAAGDEWILVYGGSSAVGQCAVRLASLSGYKVVSTASPRNFGLVKSLGASEVFDYKDPDVASKIKKATGDSIAKAVDTISEKTSLEITADSVSPDGGDVVLVLPIKPDATIRADVRFNFTCLYTALGREFTLGNVAHFPASTEDRAHMAQFLKKLPKLVQDGVVKPLPVKLWEGGLAVIPEGLQYMREGKVSAEKIVYRV